MTFKDLLLLIPRSFPIDDANYAIGVEEHPPHRRFEFMMHHQLTHMTKNTGALGELLERHDHVGGRLMDMYPIDPRKALLEIVVKGIVNAIEIAHLTGLSAEELEREIRKRHDPSYVAPMTDSDSD